MPATDWQPTVDDVGALLRARTKDDSQNYAGTFTDGTTPTRAEVELLVESATGDLADMLTVDVPERLWRSARRVVTYSAAMDVELSYYPEAVATGRSPYDQMKARYDELLESFKLALANEELPVDPGLEDPAGSPSYYFPPGPYMGLNHGRW